MVLRLASATGVLVVTLLGASAWLMAPQQSAPVSGVSAVPRPEARWPLSPERAPALRQAALARAQVRLSPAPEVRLDLDVDEPPLTCRFLPEPPSGTSPKFDCVLPSGEVIKVKYGRNPEVVAEVAATRLLSALGYPADRMTVARRVRCQGCPRHPFAAMRIVHVSRLLGGLAPGEAPGYTDFEWAAVERKLEAPAIETPAVKGWAWWELDAIDPANGASRADLDAFRLLAIFLAHWDNKSENQRLVCLDAASGPDRACARPLAMLQDLGATFGPAKANLARWHDLPIWADRAACVVSMEGMPFGGGTFPEARIGEAGRRQLAAQLAALSRAQVRGLFRAARFPEYYSGTHDEKDLDAWSEAFQHRVDQIVSAGPCLP